VAPSPLEPTLNANTFGPTEYPRGHSDTRRPDGRGESSLRDRDAIYSDVFRRRVASIGISEVISSPLSPWQNPYAERLIGSMRRECLDHVIVFNQTHLRRTLARYVFSYHGSRTHLSLAKDAPTPRRVQAPAEGRVIEFPEVRGLHHRYERRAA